MESCILTFPWIKDFTQK